MKRVFVGAVAVAACAYGYACDSSPQSHVYVAALYDGVSCFAASSSLGYVNTADGALDCAPTCLVTTTSTGQTLIYVSTMCGPYPPGYDTSQTILLRRRDRAWASAGGPGACVGSEDAGEDSATGSDAGEDGATREDGAIGDSSTDGDDPGRRGRRLRCGPGLGRPDAYSWPKSTFPSGACEARRVRRALDGRVAARHDLRLDRARRRRGGRGRPAVSPRRREVPGRGLPGGAGALPRVEPARAEPERALQHRALLRSAARVPGRVPVLNVLRVRRGEPTTRRSRASTKTMKRMAPQRRDPQDRDRSPGATLYLDRKDLGTGRRTADAPASRRVRTRSSRRLRATRTPYRKERRQFRASGTANVTLKLVRILRHGARRRARRPPGGDGPGR